MNATNIFFHTKVAKQADCHLYDFSTKLHTPTPFPSPSPGNEVAFSKTAGTWLCSQKEDVSLTTKHERRRLPGLAKLFLGLNRDLLHGKAFVSVFATAVSVRPAVASGERVLLDRWSPNAHNVFLAIDVEEEEVGGIHSTPPWLLLKDKCAVIHMAIGRIEKTAFASCF